MVARSEFTQFSLRSVVGWLRVSLTGDGKRVNSILLRGNNGEQVAGMIYVDTATAEATLASERGEASDEEQVGGVGGGLVFDDAIFETVMLDCGSGVELSAEPTEFYIALLPQTFEQGITLEVLCEGYKPMKISTEKSITIERNHIQPMATVEHDADIYVPLNELWYTGTEKVEPSTLDGFNVAITANEWDETTGKGVITFDGVLTKVVYCAFQHCDGLISISLPDSVTEVDGTAFRYCSNFAQFNGKFATEDGRCLINDGVILAYANASGSEFTIPEGVTTISDFAFMSCDHLESITIGDEVTTIGKEAFTNCTSLMHVNGGNGVEIIDSSAFSSCSAMLSFTIGDKVTHIGVAAFFYCYNLRRVVMGENVISIEDMAFAECDHLVDITLPAGVTTISDNLFSYSTNLKTITIPAGVTTIESLAFYDCRSLQSVYCQSTTPPVLGRDVFDNNSAERKIYVPASEDDSIINAYKTAEGWSELADYIFEDESL